MYAVSGKFDLGELHPSELLFISDDGQHIILVNIGHWLGEDILGIRVYARNGDLLKRWKLADFLTAKQIRSCALTGSTTQWFESGICADGGFSFQGPSQTFQGLKSSATVMRGANRKAWYSFTIDFQKMEISKD